VICPTKCPTHARLEGVAAPAKLTDAAVKQIRRRMGKGEYQTDLAKEFGVNRKTIRRRVDALERAQAELDARRAANRVRRQAAREKRKLLEREREGAVPPIHTNPVNRQPRRDAYSDWLDRPKNLTGRELAEATGLVRICLPDLSIRKAVERETVEAWLDQGWVLDDSFWSDSSRVQPAND
jgi:transposase